MSEPELAGLSTRRAGAPYSAALARAVEVADRRAESPLETVTRLLLLPVLPGLEPQVLVLDHAARPVARLDLGDEAARFGVEADGARYHGGAALAADRARERRLAAQGWALERVTWFDVRRRGPATRARVLAAAARHATARRA